MNGVVWGVLVLSVFLTWLNELVHQGGKYRAKPIEQYIYLSEPPFNVAKKNKLGPSEVEKDNLG